MAEIEMDLPGQPALRAYSGLVALGFYDLVCAITVYLIFILNYQLEIPKNQWA